LYQERNIKKETEELIKDKGKWELELIVIDLYYDKYELLENLKQLKAKYE